MMECKVNWLPSSGMAFMAETSTGHILNMDGAPEAGGRNLAPRPMELMLAGAGGCTAFDVVLILQRSRQNISACEVSMQAERAETDPKVFTKINLHFRVSGVNLDPSKVERAIQLSHDKYCSATAMLGRTAEITHSFEVVQS
jgi:putative redox protein